MKAAALKVATPLTRSETPMYPKGADPAAQAPTPTREQLIDEYGELDRQYRLWQPKEKRYEALKAEIKGWYENAPAEQPQACFGHLYQINLTAMQNESTPDTMKLWKKFGKAGFLKLIVIYKTAVQKALAAINEPSDEAAVEAYFTKGRTGSRRMTAVLKSAPAA